MNFGVKKKVQKMINFETIQKANELIQTTKVKNKDYAEVNQRIKAFRFLYPKGRIDTTILSHELVDEKYRVIICAKVFDEEGNLLGSGTAYEIEGSSYINATSYIENCETSAVGRALAMCGIGIDTSIASYEEVSNAQVQQQANETINEVEQKTLVAMFEQNGQTKDDCLKWFKVDDVSKITAKQYADFMHKLNKKGAEK